jgi:hypothetical protein
MLFIGKLLNLQHWLQEWSALEWNRAQGSCTLQVLLKVHLYLRVYTWIDLQ